MFLPGWICCVRQKLSRTTSSRAPAEHADGAKCDEPWKQRCECAKGRGVPDTHAIRLIQAGSEYVLIGT